METSIYKVLFIDICGNLPWFWGWLVCPWEAPMSALCLDMVNPKEHRQGVISHQSVGPISSAVLANSLPPLDPLPID